MADPKLIVHRDPEILGGTPVFVGTRVPVKILFDYLEAGDSLEVFLDEFPSVTARASRGCTRTGPRLHRAGCASCLMSPSLAGSRVSCRATRSKPSRGEVGRA